MKDQIIPLTERFETIHKNFSEISKNFEIVQSLKEFSIKNKSKIFFDSEDYFIFSRDYSKVENFILREKELPNPNSFGEDFERTNLHYIDFFMEFNREKQAIPIYVREKNLISNKMRIVYSDFFSHKEREHQIYWTHIYEEKIIKHPVKLEKIIKYYEIKNLNSELLENLRVVFLDLRTKNPKKSESERRTVL